MSKAQEIAIDRAFDAACVSEADPKWSKEIYERLVNTYPQNRGYIDGLMKLYTGGLKANAEYCTSRRDYLLSHKETVRLRYK